MRWVSAPPTSSEYFSTRPKPGVVFRVPATLPCQPCSLAVAIAAAAAVATPEARERMLSTVRSAISKQRTGPETSATAHLQRDRDMTHICDRDTTGR